MPHVEANGVDLYYEERGAGAPILGVHGAGSAAVFWEEAAERLSEVGRVIIYDRRGSYRSARPDPYEVTSIAEHAADARALLRALDAEPAIVIGRSYGGTMALELAVHHPHAIRGLALLEPGPLGFAPAYDAWWESLHARLEQAREERGVDAVGEVVLRDVFGAWEELPAVWRDVFTANGQALLAEVRGGERLSDSSRLDALNAPTVVVIAEDSPEPFRQAAEALGRALPAAREARVAGGHAIDPAGPEVLAFVSDVLATTAQT